VGAKPLTLPFHVCHAAAVEAVVVEPRLADRHHPRQRRALDKVVQARLGDALTFAVRVHTDRCPELGVRRRQRMNVGELLQQRADDERAVHLGVGHRGAHFIDAAMQLGQGQVAMGIDVHRTGAARGGAGSDRLRRLGRLDHCAEHLFDAGLEQPRLLVGRETHADPLRATA
jgi:hypothetical protein